MLSSTEVWQVVRDDNADAFEISDQFDQVIAHVPLGGKPVEMERQRRVRDLVLAAPLMQRALLDALTELDRQPPDLAIVRNVLGQGLLASRGQG